MKRILGVCAALLLTCICVFGYFYTERKTEEKKNAENNLVIRKSLEGIQAQLKRDAEELKKDD